MIVGSDKTSDKNTNLPEGWVYLTVEKCVNKDKSAIKIGPFGSSLKKEYLTKDGYKVYGQENIIEENFNIGDRYINMDRFEALKSNEIEPGDIVMSMMGTVGKSMIVPNGIQRGIMDSHLLRIRIDEEIINKEFFIHQFKDYFPTMRQIQQLSVGGIMSGLSSSIVKKIKLVVPPLDEQQKIASILSTWERAIKLRENLVEQKKHYNKGLMQKLLMGHIRLNDEKKSRNEVQERFKLIELGEVPKGYKKTKIGIIPEGWKLVHLKDKFDRLIRKNSRNNTNVLTISAQNGLVNQQKYFNKSVASENLSNYYLLSKGDFAYNKSYSKGYPYGAIKLLKGFEEGVVSPLYICFTPKKDNLCPEFYEYYFEAGIFNREIHAIAQEGARNHGLLNVPINDFLNLYIVDFEINVSVK